MARPHTIVLLALATGLAAAAPHRPTRQERPAMSDAHTQGAIRAEVTATLRRYDQTRDPGLLQAASDQASREDGTPADPQNARPAGQDRIALWVELLSRFKRDMDPGFDPDAAPTLQVRPPLVGSMQLPPGVPPSSIKDPELRKKYEADIAGNKNRIARFATQNKLHEAHMAVLDRAAASVRDAHQTLGLSRAEVAAALARGDILEADVQALTAAARD